MSTIEYRAYWSSWKYCIQTSFFKTIVEDNAEDVSAEINDLAALQPSLRDEDDHYRHSGSEPLDGNSGFGA